MTGITGEAIARDRDWGVSARTCRRAIQSLKESGQVKVPIPGGLRSPDTLEGCLDVETDSAEMPQSLEDLIALFSVDLGKWTPECVTPKAWEVFAKIGEEMQVKVLHSLAARFKRRPTWDDLATLREALLGDITAAEDWKSERQPDLAEQGRRLVVIAPSDVHMGALCWGEETGSQNYDLQIACRDLLGSVAWLIDRVSRIGRPARVLLPVGNDLLHIDNVAATTTAGTPQDIDGRYHKTFRAAVETYRTIVGWCLDFADCVDVRIVPGNHDTLSSFTVGEVLRAIYAEHPRVHVVNSPNPRTYYRWGATLLQLTHGRDEKLTDLAMIAAAEAGEDWGQCPFREALTGHYHSELVCERTGFLRRQLPSLAPPTAWGARKGFVGNKRRAMALEYDFEDGMIGSHVYTVPRG